MVALWPRAGATLAWAEVADEELAIVHGPHVDSNV